MAVPDHPKIYHIVHVDRLPHIIAAKYLYSDAHMQNQQDTGTVIGMATIKKRRQTKILGSYPDVCVGDCVPFYFCPRSVMLYLFSKNNMPDLNYRGGQDPIVHLEADLYTVLEWANEQKRAWVFTTSNAGSDYFDDYCATDDLDKIDWQAVASRDWRQCRDGKQAEFLLNDHFPWTLVERIGVFTDVIQQQVNLVLSKSEHKPSVDVLRSWYY